ncbi:MAG: deoxyribonuclease V [Candidatus Poribacteria bacterium]
MKYHNLHLWNLAYDEAINIQKKLSSDVILQPYNSELKFIAGADVSYSKNSDLFFAGVIVLQFPNMIIVEESIAVDKVDFPYIPGLLSFRESPILIKAFEKLNTIPDVVMIDGQGIAHPRGLGIASHLGLLLDTPTIGCAKNILIGHYDKLGISAGDHSPIIFNGKVIGAVLRTKKNISPIFVSPGHKMDIPSAIDIVMKTCRGYRLPEPTRQAHLLVNRVRIAHLNLNN